MRIEEKYNQKLLVEGSDDQHVVWAICQKLNITKSFDVIDSVGISELLKDIPVRIKQRPLTLGIIVDADTDLSRRWQQVSDILSDSDYQLPAIPNIEGTIVDSPREGFLPKIGIWLMPNNELPGMLEDFIQFLVPSNDESLEFAKETLTTLENRDLHSYIPNHHAKALIHTWLAWQEDPGTPIGLAITRRFLSTEMEVCQRFVDWMNRLFNTAVVQ